VFFDIFAQQAAEETSTQFPPEERKEFTKYKLREYINSIYDDLNNQMPDTDIEEKDEY
jgi:hypothetical protein